MTKNALAIFCTVLQAFAEQEPVKAPTFEVASIKVNKSGSAGGSLGPRGNRLVANNITLAALVQYAYAPPGGRVLNPQLIGGPDWLRTERFDIDARAEGNERIPAAQFRVMLQALLEDRFQLKLHRDTRELPVYNLVVVKDGPKPSEDQTPPETRNRIISFASENEPLSSLPRGGLRMITGPTTTTLAGTAISVQTLVMLLQGQSDRMIFDKTGFDRLIDVHLEFKREDANPPDPDAAGSFASPSLFTALRDIGLRLAPAKAPMEVLIVDSVEHPTEN